MNVPWTRYVTVLLVVMGLYVPPVLSWGESWRSANTEETLRHQMDTLKEEVSVITMTQNKCQQKVKDFERSLEDMSQAVKKLTSSTKEIADSLKQANAEVQKISILTSSLPNLKKSVRETNETTLDLRRKAEGIDMRIKTFAAELADLQQEIEQKMMHVYSKLQETCTDKMDKMDNSQDISKGQLNIVFKYIAKTDKLVAVVVAIVIVQVAQLFLFWRRIAPN